MIHVSRYGCYLPQDSELIQSYKDYGDKEKFEIDGFCSRRSFLVDKENFLVEVTAQEI